MTDTHDDELRARFQQLRDDDAANAPPFRPLWERAEAKARCAPRARTWAPVWVAAAVVVLLAAGVVVRRSDEGKRIRLGDRTQNTTPSLSKWTSPTASLLHAPLRDLLEPPSVLSSTLDGVIQAPVNYKGVPR